MFFKWISCPGIFCQVTALAIGLSSFHSFTQELKDNPWDTWLPGHSLPLSHHFVVWLAAELVYPGVVTPFRNYAILGDDIVILDSLVAAKYRELLDDLGVQIEPMKSLSLELALLSLQNDYGSAEDKESHLFLSV
ncbi:hypothetical protein L1987_88300 [Smallanthus sonchifolius]|nr:hypothetical protein L1987_89798 [Smallanthus sonchifolius]KAI3664571.1 hypothetical protein L1987_89661 [Smallanthus sonchifolius]KAI3666084.1 hypothetical protein L1987_89436 [Smallanthus sonchifolius]KAI3666362.1 hypothetical protein L1987_89136 [Smallanthus sonchifolius]KAI3666689.1 hypothetical protein L1987_88784 [Smallanthus sonchifolius]